MSITSFPHYFQRYLDNDLESPEAENIIKKQRLIVGNIYRIISYKVEGVEASEYLRSLASDLQEKRKDIDKVTFSLKMKSREKDFKSRIVVLRIGSLIRSLKEHMTESSLNIYNILNLRKNCFEDCIESVPIRETQRMLSEWRSNFQNIYEMSVGLAIKFGSSIHKYYNINEDDSIQNCLEGLLEAIQTFDENAGVSFKTYAYVCMQEKNRRSHNMDIFSKDSTHARYHTYIQSVYDSYQKQGKDKPTEVELAKELSLSEKETRNYLCSLDISIMPFFDFVDDGKSMAMSSYDDTDENIDNERLKSVIQSVLHSMDEMTRIITSHQFGLNGYEQLSRVSLAKKYNLNENVIRKIKADGLSFLKKELANRGFDDF